jgi:hypothetical protein
VRESSENEFKINYPRMAVDQNDLSGTFIADQFRIHMVVFQIAFI